uniref:Reverse transcriptase domain-containing protein n=1 Tax=Cannabis sativa TaxID=3483 RepID=A0A803P5U5_CANSA
MSCLSTNSFSFLINGEVTGSLIPSRGLQQGCPLSPYLFLICAEGLSKLLQHEQDIDNLHGFKLIRRAPMISHLLFVDDSLLFCQADESLCLAIKRVLDTYHQASGQLINPDKSVMSFSPNTTLAAQVYFHRHLSMPISECHEKYLGLPSYFGRDKKELFSHIKERISKLMQSWNEKNFSAGGREVLLKAVVQSIPTYATSCFRLPVYFYNQLESMMANFWWGMNENGSKIHWRSWNLLCKTKGEGGMGFRSFIHFNQALLAKQAWRLVENPNSLLRKLLKSKYFPHNSFLQASVGHSPSLTWQGIRWGRELLIQGLRWKISEGRSIRSGFDPWIHGHTTFTPIQYSGPRNGVVANLITDEKQWNLSLLQQYFSPLDVEKILTMPLSYFPTRDKLIWHHHSFGKFSVDASMKNGDYLQHLSSIYNKAEMEQLFCTLWAIWTERNKVVHGKNARCAVDLALYSMVFLQNYKNAQVKTTSAVNVEASGSSHHVSPPTAAHVPWCPSDASTSITGVGAVLRDANGQVKAALSMPILRDFKSHEMEAKSLFHSLNWALQQQLPISHIETNALMVANAVKAPFSSNSEFSDLIIDVLSLLSFFPNVNVTHVKRSANNAAHGLAKFALGVDETCTWLEIIPPPIYSVIVNESLFV